MKITGNEPAMPITLDDSSNEYYTGLTIRQEFARTAMQGLLANAPNGHLSNSKEGCQLAVQWADDLITELNKSDI